MDWKECDVMTRTIVVPLDGSELAEKALPYAVALAKKTGAHLLLLSVVAPMETWIAASGVYLSDERLAEEADAAQRYLASVQERLGREDTRTSVLYGRAAAAIREVAEAENAATIAMTTHGRSGLPRLVLGSVAGEVVRTSPTPVLLVPAGAGAGPEVTIRRVLVPLDGSELSEAVLPEVRDIASRFDAEVALLRVIVPPVALFPEQVMPSSLPALAEIEAGAKAYLDDVVTKLHGDGIKATAEVTIGYPAEAVLSAAADGKADLIAMSSHGRTGLGRLVLGSTADAVVRQARVPCFVARPAAVAAEQHLAEPAGVVEVIEGVSAARTIIPPPAFSEVPASEAPEPTPTVVRPHRPDRPGKS